MSTKSLDINKQKSTKICPHYDCSLKVKSNSVDFNVRWESTDKGMEIFLNPTNIQKTDNREILFNNTSYIYANPVRISFHRSLDLKINGVSPDCVVVLDMATGTYLRAPGHGNKLRVYIPFSNNKGDPRTKATEQLQKIVTHISTYQPRDTDQQTIIYDLNTLDFFPSNGSYYEADPTKRVSKMSDSTIEEHSIFVDTIQAIDTETLNRVNSMTNIDSENIDEILRIPGMKFNISSYFRAESKIEEGMSNLTEAKVMQMINAKMKAGQGPSDAATKRNTRQIKKNKKFINKLTNDMPPNLSNDIYIDCRPVGEDEDYTDVVEKDKGGIFSGTFSLEYLWYLIFLAVSIGMLYGIHFIMTKKF